MNIVFLDHANLFLQLFLLLVQTLGINYMNSLPRIQSADDAPELLTRHYKIELTKLLPNVSSEVVYAPSGDRQHSHK